MRISGFPWKTRYARQQVRSVVKALAAVTTSDGCYATLPLLAVLRHTAVSGSFAFLSGRKWEFTFSVDKVTPLRTNAPHLIDCAGHYY